MARRSLLLSSVVIFFGLNIFAGERGIFAHPELDRKIMLAEEKLGLLNKHHDFLSQRIELMQADSLDADMLTEIARAELGLYASNDVIITIDLAAEDLIDPRIQLECPLSCQDDLTQSMKEVNRALGGTP